MSIKSQGGVFGRNPTFNDVTVEGDLSIAGTLSVGGETITGLSYQGGWNASTNTPDIAASSPVTGQFWIVSADGSTNVGGITNWTSGDWALYDGSAWQRVEGGNTDLTTGVQGQLAVANGGTGAADASTARTNLSAASAAQGALADTALQPADIGVSVQGYDATILTSSDIGSTVQGYDAGTLTSADIGSTVQAYDANTAKTDVANTFTTDQTINGNLTVDTDTLKVNASTNRVGINYSSPSYTLDVNGGADNTVMRLRSSDDTCDMLLEDNGSTSMIRHQNGDLFLSADINNEDAASSEMYFQVDGTTHLKITSAGTVELTTGNLKVPSGNGIDFSATSGTGTSELLDDYEEGTWTPTLPQNGSVTYSTQFGRYTKIGNTVTVWFTVAASSWSGGSGNLNIGGLPYITNIEGNFGFGGSLIRSVGVNLSSGYTSASLMANSTSGSHLAVYELGDNVSAVALNYSALSTTGAISGTVTYRTS